MDNRGVRLGGAGEWLVALAFLVATVVVAALIVREMRTVRTTAPSAAPIAAPQAAPPAGLPEHAISVPSLLLLDGRQVRVGDTLDHVTSQLGSSCQVAADVVEEGVLGNRITRSCDHAGTKFVLVFAPYERNGPPHVTAIYLR